MGNMTSRGKNSIFSILYSQFNEVGTSVYMAPEIFLGKPYGKNADSFSFGIMMFEILMEDFKPYGKDITGVETKVANSPDFRPQICESKLSSGDQENISFYLNLMRHCWAHDAGNRPGFAQILQELAKGGESNVDVELIQSKVVDREEEMKVKERQMEEERKKTGTLQMSNNGSVVGSPDSFMRKIAQQQPPTQQQQQQPSFMILESEKSYGEVDCMTAGSIVFSSVSFYFKYLRRFSPCECPLGSFMYVFALVAACLPALALSSVITIPTFLYNYRTNPDRIPETGEGKSIAGVNTILFFVFSVPLFPMTYLLIQTSFFVLLIPFHFSKLSFYVDQITRGKDLQTIKKLYAKSKFKGHTLSNFGKFLCVSVGEVALLVFIVVPVTTGICIALSETVIIPILLLVFVCSFFFAHYANKALLFWQTKLPQGFAYISTNLWSNLSMGLAFTAVSLVPGLNVFLYAIMVISTTRANVLREYWAFRKQQAKRVRSQQSSSVVQQQRPVQMVQHRGSYYYGNQQVAPQMQQQQQAVQQVQNRNSYHQTQGQQQQQQQNRIQQQQPQVQGSAQQQKQQQSINNVVRNNAMAAPKTATTMAYVPMYVMDQHGRQQVAYIPQAVQMVVPQQQQQQHQQQMVAPQQRQQQQMTQQVQGSQPMNRPSVVVQQKVQQRNQGQNQQQKRGMDSSSTPVTYTQNHVQQRQEGSNRPVRVQQQVQDQQTIIKMEQQEKTVVELNPDNKK